MVRPLLLLAGPCIGMHNCDYIFPGFCNAVPRVLADVLVVEIRQYARRAFRYMDAYRIGLTGEATEVAVKKYRSHR